MNPISADVVRLRSPQVDLRLPYRMKLLIVTQRVDAGDPILGFFLRWIEEFSTRCEQVTVIAQGAGNDPLPSNVHVLSLGKDQDAPRWKQIVTFWKLVFMRRKEYDAVLVHMTPVWVVLGKPLFFLLRKPVFLWYEIRRGGWMLRCALLFVRKVFSATRDGLPFPSRKQVVTGHGIDTERFSPLDVARGLRPSDGERDSHLLLTVGRLTRIKRHELFLRALEALPPPYRLRIAGDGITADDRLYRRELETLMDALHIRDRVEIGPVPHRELPSLLQRCALYLHAAGGGLDKALLEAMACGCIAVSASEASLDLLPDPSRATPETFNERVKALLALPADDQQTVREKLRKIVVENHALPRLMERLRREMEQRGA